MRFYSFLFVSLLVATTIIHAEDDDGEMDLNDETTKITRRPKTSTAKPMVDEDRFPKCDEIIENDQTSFVCERKVDDKIEHFGIKYDNHGGFYCGGLEDLHENGKGFRYFYDDSSFEGYECGDFVDGFKNGWYVEQQQEYNNISLQSYPDEQHLEPSLTFNPAKDQGELKWYDEGDDQCFWIVSFDKFGKESQATKTCS